eukprot:3236338-Pleurochrysis_carterae.AAC.1
MLPPSLHSLGDLDGSHRTCPSFSFPPQLSPSRFQVLHPFFAFCWCAGRAIECFRNVRSRRRVHSPRSAAERTAQIRHAGSRAPRSHLACASPDFEHRSYASEHRALHLHATLVDYPSALTFSERNHSAARVSARARAQAFKAANPGCVLEDFVRWHSPRDWIPLTENDDVDFTQHDGRSVTQIDETCAAQGRATCVAASPMDGDERGTSTSVHGATTFGAAASAGGGGREGGGLATSSADTDVQGMEEVGGVDGGANRRVDASGSSAVASVKRSAPTEAGIQGCSGSDTQMHAWEAGKG